MSASKSLKIQSNIKPKLFPCSICKKLTDQTCSLCRKVFYCSAQHQQIDWHMRHKSQCQGKILSNSQHSHQHWNTNQTYPDNNRVFFSNDTLQIQKKANQVRLQNESKQFMDLFEQRIIIRRKVMDKYLKLVQSSVPIQQSECLSMLQQLNQISQTLITIFKPSFIPILQEMYGITTSNFILKLDQILDKSLLAKYYLLTHKHQQVRKYLFQIHDQLPLYEINDSRFRQVYENVLKTILKISQVHCNDKVTEGILSKFILIVQKFDGIWQQIYSYFNMGNWYLQKTYYFKAIKCFNYSLQLLNIHHKSKNQSNDPSTLTKADLLYNLALAQYSINNYKEAFDNMQQSYRLRSKAIGKNSIQASYCLQNLSKWSFTNKLWQDCLQYAKQCYRVRKLNKINYPKQLQTIQKLLQNIHIELKKQKQKNQSQMNIKPIKYYQTLINPTKNNQSNPALSQPQQSFIKQLNSSLKQEIIQPKIIITPQMAQTYNSNQWDKLTKLLYETDKPMEKQQFRRIIFQSQFTQTLNQLQKDIFIKANKID